MGVKGICFRLIVNDTYREYRLILVFHVLVCGGDLQTQMGQFASPNYPHTLYLPPYLRYTYVFARCHWKLRLQASNVSAILVSFRNFFWGEREYKRYCRYFIRKIIKPILFS